MKKIDRTNEVNTSNEGYLMKIVNYNNSHDIIIEFQDKHKARVHTNYGAFKNGEVRNPYYKNVYSIGYIGQGKYNSKEHKKTWSVWYDMLRRCYDPYELNKYPTYIDCYVCEEWLNFQNFAKWYEENYYKVTDGKMCLDKDILFKGNKIYSLKTCIFVPERINILFTKSNKIRGEYPVGIYYCKQNNKLRVQCGVYDDKLKKKKKVHLGYFSLDEPFKAFTAYKSFKENYIKKVADEYKELIPIELYEAMYRYEVEIND